MVQREAQELRSGMMANTHSGSWEEREREREKEKEREYTYEHHSHGTHLHYAHSHALLRYTHTCIGTQSMYT